MSMTINPPVELDLDRTYTLEEFLELDLPEDEDYELIEGKLVPKEITGKSAEHGEIIGRLMQHLNNYLDSNPLGRVYDQAPCTLGWVGARGNWVEPDVSFVAAGRTPPKFEGPIQVAPDLVIEVISPSDTPKKTQEKIEVYQAAGVRLLWLVYMPFRYVIIYRLNEPRRGFLDLMDELGGGEVLPDFKLAVKELFK